MMTRSVQPLVNGNIEVTIPIYIRREGTRVSMNKNSENEKKGGRGHLSASSQAYHGISASR